MTSFTPQTLSSSDLAGMREADAVLGSDLSERERAVANVFDLFSRQTSAPSRLGVDEAMFAFGHKDHVTQANTHRFAAEMMDDQPFGYGSTFSYPDCAMGEGALSGHPPVLAAPPTLPDAARGSVATVFFDANLWLGDAVTEDEPSRFSRDIAMRAVGMRGNLRALTAAALTETVRVIHGLTSLVEVARRASGLHIHWPNLTSAVSRREEV